MKKIKQRVKLNSLVEVKDLRIQVKEKLECDLGIGLEGKRDAFHAKGNGGSILLEARGVCP
jgi:hypothetical protein